MRDLMREYAETLGVDLSYQNFDRELQSLPGEYAPPGGTLLLAIASEEAAGCVAIRPLAEKFCEMKRLYVRPAWRSTGLGKRLVEAALDDARGAGHEYVRLDTLPLDVVSVEEEHMRFLEVEPDDGVGMRHESSGE